MRKAISTKVAIMEYLKGNEGVATTSQLVDVMCVTHGKTSGATRAALHLLAGDGLLDHPRHGVYALPGSYEAWRSINVSL